MRLNIGQRATSANGNFYENIKPLGEGGNSTTFLVIGTNGSHTGVPFAMKVFTRISDAERREDFDEEFKFLRDCNHPSVMKVVETGAIYDKFPFFLAEYLPHTLKRLIKSENPLIVEKLSYTLQILSGLDYLANLADPIIHRDIKPPNLFLKGHSCVLGDFGLLKRVNKVGDADREVFKRSGGPGMPIRYRTPDLVEYLRNGKPPTTKSDIFQFGLVVAEIFTNANPERPGKFEDDVELDVLGSIQSELEEPIKDLIGRMLVMDADQRDSASVLLPAWHGLLIAAMKNARTRREQPFS